MTINQLRPSRLLGLAQILICGTQHEGAADVPLIYRSQAHIARQFVERCLPSDPHMYEMNKVLAIGPARSVLRLPSPGLTIPDVGTC
jgi:hypothetical protein